MSKIKQVGNTTYLEEEMEITGLSTVEKSIEELNDYLLKKISKVEKENIKLKKRKEKLEKAWEIVRKKKVDCSFMFSDFAVEDYNHHEYLEKYKLTETEFNLLKEMLEEK